MHIGNFCLSLSHLFTLPSMHMPLGGKGYLFSLLPLIRFTLLVIKIPKMLGILKKIKTALL